MAVLGLAGLVYFFKVGNSLQVAPSPVSNRQIAQQSGTTQAENAPQTGRYQEYSPAAFEAAADQRRVLFFHAPWCPTCRPLHAQLLENENRIPEDVVIFKTDYDSSTELKSRYGVTYQHTFVQVDRMGEKIKIWNGGLLEDLLANIL